MNAEELAKDDDYSLSCDLFDLMCNDDEIRENFNKLVAAYIEYDTVAPFSGTRTLRKMVELGADFYKERAYDNE